MWQGWANILLGILVLFLGYSGFAGDAHSLSMAILGISIVAIGIAYGSMFESVP